MAFNTVGKSVTIDCLIRKVALINEATGLDLWIDYPENSHGFILKSRRNDLPPEMPLGMIGRSRSEANKVLDAIKGGMVMADPMIFERARVAKIKATMEACQRL